MAHLIDQSMGRSAVFATREMNGRNPLWHGLGTLTEKALTREEAEELSGTKFIVRPVPLLIGYFRPAMLIASSKACSLRSRPSPNCVLFIRRSGATLPPSNLP